MTLKSPRKLLSYLQDISQNGCLSFSHTITQKNLRQAHCDSRRTSGLMDAREWRGASVDTVCVLGWVDRGGGAEVDLSDGLLSAGVLCCVEDWWGGLGGLVMHHGNVFAVTKGSDISDTGNDPWPVKTELVMLTCNFAVSRDLDVSRRSERGSFDDTVPKKPPCFP